MNDSTLRKACCMLLLMCTILCMPSCSEDVFSDNPTFTKLLGTWTVKKVQGEHEFDWLEVGDKLIMRGNSHYEIKGKAPKYEGKWGAGDGAGAGEILFSSYKAGEYVPEDGSPTYHAVIDELDKHTCKMSLTFTFSPSYIWNIELTK